MITLTPSEAQDVMNAQILLALTASSVAALLGANQLNILWEGNEIAGTLDRTKYNVRISHQTVLEKQANLSSCEGLPGQKRYRTYGLTYIQLFGPTSDKQVADKALKLATIARNAFRGPGQNSTDNDVWFYNARINKLTLENDLYRLNIVAEHEYDELG